MFNWIHKDCDKIILEKLGNPALGYRQKKCIAELNKMAKLHESYEEKYTNSMSRNSQFGMMRAKDMMTRTVKKSFTLVDKAKYLNIDKETLKDNLNYHSVIHKIIEDLY